MTRSGTRIAALIALAAVMACRCGPSPDMTGTEGSSSPPTVGSSEIGSVPLPIHHLTSSPEGLLLGNLREEGDCLFGAGRDPRDRALRLIIWPPGTVAKVVNEVVTVTLPSGTLRVGDDFDAGGGEYTDRRFVERAIGRPIPEACATQRFWLITELISPNQSPR